MELLPTPGNELVSRKQPCHTPPTGSIKSHANFPVDRQQSRRREHNLSPFSKVKAGDHLESS